MHRVMRRLIAIALFALLGCAIGVAGERLRGAGRERLRGSHGWTGQDGGEPCGLFGPEHGSGGRKLLQEIDGWWDGWNLDPPGQPPPGPPAPRRSTVATVAAHNALRTLSGVAPLTWDNGLARNAQAWSDKCLFRHSESSVGENLAWGLFGGPQDISANGVSRWAEEVCEYDFASPGKFLAGHWTQVVWKGTARLGCGYNACASNSANSFLGGLLVCQYFPAGNAVGVLSYKANIFPPRQFPKSCATNGGSASWG
ncbi:Golgi-associated plant pathogenesis-related protein 1 [Tetrabaena socialis]|uniref:Golgi-associated plant pathogenesis-related protein 1 n=1 Tax=Tetrabaena socialis TaxID=47790 RepID=A0A2J8AB62_9CHLO|nr:Golgi-associated plant pathogenesis-related protein 1 [Tetrabaena socialis]|eukprot:PNH09758.1 Golgi-associated plant pathogenesis-related protein 1 [Tetrabaena socialis]